MLFAFVQGTDPDLFLLLEARESGGKSAWHFAATRMNSVALSLGTRTKNSGGPRCFALGRCEWTSPALHVVPIRHAVAVDDARAAIVWPVRRSKP